MQKFKLVCSGLLVFSVLLLGILVPGGPIETRDFSHLSSVILASFNVFLTALGIVSIITSYLVLRSFSRWVYLIIAGCACSYFGVYVLDLAHIFPVSPTPMSMLLTVVEVIGVGLSIPLLVTALWLWQNSTLTKHTTGSHLPSWFFIATTALLSFGLIIIIFATHHAMHGV